MSSTANSPVYFLMFKRPVGRPPKDTARRLSGYKVRAGYTLLPEPSLLALALWAIAEVPTDPTTPSNAAVFGAFAGLAWAGATRMSLSLVRALKGAIGALGLAASFSALARGDECSEALAGGVAALIGLIMAAAFSTAILVGFWKHATLRKADLPSFVLAALGLIELVEFAVAPAGQEIVTDLSGGIVPTLLLAGILLAAALSAINPRVTEAMLGVGVALGVAYLLLLHVQQYPLALGPGCVDVLPQLVMVATFTVVAVVAGSGED
jgi:hypothetical protein